MKAEVVVAHLESHRNEVNREGMSRYGIKVDQAFGISMVELRSLAKTLGKDHRLALDLWERVP
jgi:3-methyladenine DNA glycosylase AlkD